jgi:hypothetical protein
MGEQDAERKPHEDELLEDLEVSDDDAGEVTAGTSLFSQTCTGTHIPRVSL